jgi:hypothetical protein
MPLSGAMLPLRCSRLGCAQERGQGQETGSDDRPPDGKKREQAKRGERSGRGQQGSTPVRQLPDGTVCRQQRTGQQEYQHPGKPQIALLAYEPHVVDGHCYGQGRRDQGQWLDARPRSCLHASIIA